MERGTRATWIGEQIISGGSDRWIRIWSEGELVSEFEVKGGEKVHPHQHPTYEFYYVTHGRGIMQIGDETAEVYPGDLIKIPPDTVHSLWPVSENASIHCFCFAVGLKGAEPIDYTTH